MDDEPERMDPRCDAGGHGYMLWMEYCNDGEYIRATDYDALAAKLVAAERRERQLLDTTATCRMLLRELNTANAKLAEAERVARYESDIAQQALDQMKAEKARAEAAEARIEELEEKLFSATMDGYDMAKYEYRDRIEELRAESAEAKLAKVEEDCDDLQIALASARKQLERYIADGSVMAQKLDAAEAKLAAANDLLDRLEQMQDNAEAALPAVYRMALEDAAERLLAAVTREYKGHRDYRKAIRALPTPTAAELMARIQTGEKE